MELMDRRYDRSQRSAVVTGIVLVLIGALALMAQFIPGLGLMVWAAALGAGGALIVGVYFTDRSQPGVLIPAYVLFAIAGLLTGLALNLLRDMAIPVYVLMAVAIPFIYGFTRNPAKNWGLLIPAYVLTALSGMLWLIGANILRDLAIPAYVMFSIALPFLIAFLVKRENWGFLIPGGIMFALGTGFLLGTNLMRYGFPVMLILFGLLVLIVPLARRASYHEPSMPDEPIAAKTGPEADKVLDR